MRGSFVISRALRCLPLKPGQLPGQVIAVINKSIISKLSGVSDQRRQLASVGVGRCSCCNAAVLGDAAAEHDLDNPVAGPSSWCVSQIHGGSRLLMTSSQPDERTPLLIDTTDELPLCALGNIFVKVDHG